MGGSESKRDESFRPNQWEEVNEGEYYEEAEGQFTVVRNRITGQELDRYTLRFPNQTQYKKYLESISYRRNQPNIVRVIHYEPRVIKQFCGSTYMLNVYLQRCRSRLSQYQDIPFPDYLYCSIALLDGYKKLYDKIGRFQVNEQQAMIDNEGQVRVWLNSDFSENQAEDFAYQQNHGPKNTQQYLMVDDIMKIIFNNSDESDGPRLKLYDFYERQKINSNNNVGFQQAKNIIAQYSRAINVPIPNLFKAVYEIYRSNDNQKLKDTITFKNHLMNQPDNSTNRIEYIPKDAEQSIDSYAHPQLREPSVRNQPPHSTINTGYHQPFQTQNPVISIPPLQSNHSSRGPLNSQMGQFVANSVFQSTNRSQIPSFAQPNMMQVYQDGRSLQKSQRNLSQRSFGTVSPRNYVISQPQLMRPGPVPVQVPFNGYQQPLIQNYHQPIVQQRPSFPMDSRPINPANLINQVPIIRLGMPNKNILVQCTGPQMIPRNMQQNPTIIQSNPQPQSPQGQNIGIATQIIKKQSSKQAPRANPEELTIKINTTYPDSQRGQSKISSKRQKIEYSQQQMQIQRNLILKSSNNPHEDISQAQIYNELKQLKELQNKQKQSQKQYRQDDQKSQSNQYNHHQFQDNEEEQANLYINHKMEEEKDQNDQVYEHQLEHQNEHEQSQDVRKSQNTNNVNANTVIQNLFSTPVNQQNTITTQNYERKMQTNQPQIQQMQQNQYMRHQGNHSPPYIPSHSANQSTYKSVQIGQTNTINQVQQLNQLNQANIKNQINQMETSPYSRASSKMIVYYNLDREFQIDPEIAADMAMIIQS